MLIEHALDILRVDILTTWTENHILKTTLDIEPAILIKAGKVTGTEPTILGKYSLCSLLVLIVANHLAWALHNELANTLIIRVFDATLNALKQRTGRAKTEHSIHSARKQRSCLGKTVTDVVDKLGIQQELLNS